MPDRHFTNPEVYRKVKVVYRHNITPTLVNRAHRFKLECITFDSKYGENKEYTTQAVGLYSIAFADTLNAKEIHLIGFDYKGLDNDGNDKTAEWMVMTTHYLKNRSSKSIIIDHSNGDFPI